MQERESRLTEAITLFISRHYRKFFIAALVALFIHLFIQTNHFESSDVFYFVKSWYLHFAKNGLEGFGTIYSETNANYPPIYLFILALLSYLPHPTNYHILFYIKLPAALSLCAIAVFTYKIVYNYNKNQDSALIAGAVALFSPIALINSLIWGQADLIYTAFIIASIYYLFKERYFLAFLLVGFSIAFKTMSVFILPFILVYTAGKYIPIRYYFLIPIPHLLFTTLAFLFGAPFKVALKQLARGGYYLTGNAPNIGSVLMPNAPVFTVHYPLYHLSLTLTFIFFLIYFYFFIINRAKIKWNWPNFILWAMVSCAAAPFFLPHMHERYFTLAEITSLIYAFIKPKYFYIPIIIHLASLSTNLIVLGFALFPLHYAGLIMMAGVILSLRAFYIETVKPT